MSALDFVGYEFFQRAIVAAIVVATLCAVLGVYVVLRGLSMLGDGLAHVSLAGVALGVVVGAYPLVFALGAAIAGALAIQVLRSREIVRADTAIGILFTAGLATGILVMTRSAGASRDLDSYLFGRLLGASATDVWVLAGVAVALLLTFALLQKELLYVTFSEQAARLSGLPVGALNVVFTVATASAVVVASRVVGVLLVSSLLVVPAATSLQLARSFRSTIVVSVLFGVAAALGGLFAAAQWDAPVGASIALASTALFALAALARGFARRA